MSTTKRTVAGANSRTLQIQSEAIPVVLGRPALEPVRLSGREGLNSLFEYELLLKTPDAGLLGCADRRRAHNRGQCLRDALAGHPASQRDACQYREHRSQGPDDPERRHSLQYLK